MPNYKKKKQQKSKKAPATKKGVAHEKAGAKMERKFKDSGAASAWKSAKQAAADKAYSFSSAASNYAKQIKNQRKK